ncbi:alpha/beta fold hydrolase [Ilumatobacter sp.]|uniref:alpha/beta fold hydrolase n=1 Tax=Ilumatobacter sp. TaxID=1967498 RepID=UPI003AF75359
MIREPIAPLEGGFVEVDGLHLYHRTCERAGRSAPAVVHLHGFGISGSYMEPTAVRMVDDARHYIPDLPGTGGSAQPPKTLDIPGATRSLVAYLDAVGLERATFVGNSLGCVTLIELAASHPERVDAIVFVSPAGGPNNQPLVKALGQMTIDGVREPFALSRIATRDYLRFGLIHSYALFRAMTRYPTIERLRDLERPLLVIIGHRDPLVDEQTVRRRLTGRSNAAAVVIDGAHALNFTHPDTVAALVRAQLDGTPLDRVTPASGTIDILVEPG